jgi:tRNA threonylcarbamoyladenosine biosynthesis protein TsaB
MRLVIETAFDACSVALLDGDRVVAARHEEIGRGHAERLVPMIAEVLAAAGAARAESVAVDVGPGSFTGIRIGIAAARALGIAWACPVAGYASTAAVAARAFAGDAALDELAVALDAARGEVFVQGFTRVGPDADATALLPEAARLHIADRAVFGTSKLLGLGGASPHAADAALWTAALVPRPIYVRPPDAKLPA